MKKLFFLTVALCATMLASAACDNYEFKEPSATVSPVSGTMTLGDYGWNYSGTRLNGDSDYFNFVGDKSNPANRRLQFGSAKNAFSNLSLTYPNTTCKVAKISVTTSGTKDSNVTVKVSVGDQLVASYSITTTLTMYDFTLTTPKVGDIKIEWENTTEKAFYLSQIAVNYEEDTPPIAIPVEKIFINEEFETIEQYREIQLTTRFEPEDATGTVVWTSSENVAIENGLVKANALGEGTVTAAAGDDATFTIDFTVVEPTVLTCAQAAEKALSVSANNQKYEGGRYVVEGYITNIAYTWKDGSMSFWIADTKGSDKTLEVYKFECTGEFASTLVEGTKVRVVAYLTKFGTTPETLEYTAAVTVIPEEPTGIAGVTLSGVYAVNGRIFGAEGARIFSISGQDVTTQNGNLKGVYIVKLAEQVMKVVVK